MSATQVISTVCLIVSMASIVFPDRVANWAFNETSDTLLIDSSNNGNNGYIHGAVRVEGVEGLAISFIDYSNYLYVANSTSLSITDKLTVECWVYLRQINPIKGSGQTILRKENSYAIGVGSEGRVGFWLHSNQGWTGSWTLSEQTLEPLFWYHIVGVWNGKTAKIYIDAVQDKKTFETNKTLSASNANVYLGKFYEGNYESLNGILDQVSVYNDTLSPLQIETNYYLHANSKIPVCIPVASPTFERRPKLLWHPVDSANSYTVQIDTVSLFTNPTTVITVSDTFFQPLVDLPMNTIFWRVSSDKYPSKFSKPDSFIILDNTQVTLIPYPEDPTINRTPLLLWHKVPGATSYTLQIDTVSTFPKPIVVISVADSFFTPLSPLPVAQIYWHVISDASSLYSLSSSFLIQSDSIPMLIRYGGITTINRRPQFLWHPVAQSTSYRIEIDTAANFSKPIQALELADTSFTPLVDLISATYYWRVSSNRNINLYCKPDVVVVDIPNAIQKNPQKLKTGINSHSQITLYCNGKAMHIPSPVSIQAASLKMYTSQGKCVYSRKCHPGLFHESIKIPSLAGGVYVLSITDSDKIILTTRLIIGR